MGKRGPAVKYVVRLVAEERQQLEGIIRTGRGAAYRLLKARILLKADVTTEGCGWDDAQIAEALETSLSTVYRTRRQLVEEGLEAALARKTQSVRQLGCAVRMQPLSKPGSLALDFDRQVRQTGRYVLFEEARFNPAGCFYHFLPILIVQNLSHLLPFYAMKSKLLPICVADHRCRCPMSRCDAFAAS
jgi:hypothetical protein